MYFCLASSLSNEFFNLSAHLVIKAHYFNSCLMASLSFSFCILNIYVSSCLIIRGFLVVALGLAFVKSSFGFAFAFDCWFGCNNIFGCGRYFCFCNAWCSHYWWFSCNIKFNITDFINMNMC